MSSPTARVTSKAIPKSLWSRPSCPAMVWFREMARQSSELGGSYRNSVGELDGALVVGAVVGSCRLALFRVPVTSSFLRRPKKAPIAPAMRSNKTKKTIMIYFFFFFFASSFFFSSPDFACSSPEFWFLFPVRDLLLPNFQEDHLELPKNPFRSRSSWLHRQI